MQDVENAIHSTLCMEKLRNKAVLITGATGLIGSFVIDVLLQYNKIADANIDIYAVGRSKQRLVDRFQEISTEKLHYIEQDVNKEPQFDIKLDYIIHAASNAYPAAFDKDPVGTILSNLLGTNYLLEYARTHDVERFLFVSSGEVYGQSDSVVEAFAENYSGYVDPVQPRSCYPTSKRAAENLCVSYTKQYGLDTVIVRPCHTYGPNVTQSDNRASVQFINNAVNNENIVMKSRGAQLRSYCYVADCASALLSVLTSGESASAYNIANKDARVTISEFAAETAKVVGKTVVYEEADTSEKQQQTPITYAVLDSEKLYALGWKGLYSVSEGVTNTVRILQNKKYGEESK